MTPAERKKFKADEQAAKKQKNLEKIDTETKKYNDSLSLLNQPAVVDYLDCLNKRNVPATSSGEPPETHH